MNILWIPHSPSEPGAHRRDQYFIDVLRERHTVRTVTWQTWKGTRSPAAYLKGLKAYPVEVDGVEAYHVRRLPGLVRKLVGGNRSVPRMNQVLFQRDVREAVAHSKADIVVAGPSVLMTGYPPFDLDVPLVFDYLDCGDWEAWPRHPERGYLEHSDAIICVGDVAVERARAHGKPYCLVPNGADIERMRSASGDEVRRRHGLEGAPVVSLIGLTCSPRMYFLESVLKARETMPDLKCLLVGRSARVENALARITEEHPDAANAFVFVGAVPYEEIAGYFAASDVGMYPVDETIYFHGASPIKMFEYSAAGKPVVVPRIREAERLAFPNFVLTRPETDDYARGIVEAFERGTGPVPEVEAYDWDKLAKDLEAFLEETVSGWQGRASRLAANG